MSLLHQVVASYHVSVRRKGGARTSSPGPVLDGVVRAREVCAERRVTEGSWESTSFVAFAIELALRL